MPVLQLNDQQFPLPAGTTRVGAGGEADISLPVDAGIGVQALVDASNGAPTIRRANPAAAVRVNGVLLGAEPTPLIHGDKVEIAGLELHFADDAKAGATQFISKANLEAAVGSRRFVPPRTSLASGGRLVSLVDGKEYAVPPSGLVFGREASSDIVVAQNEVSRRHAVISAGEQGYVVRDMSANGVFVNGERVQGSRRLSRADVLRLGSEEFRFYADVAPPEPAAPAAVPPERSGDAVPEDARLAMMSAPTPLAHPAYEDPRPVLATLETRNEGPAKGSTFSVRTPLVHVGRGAHNDVRLLDESVSETHAKLQRRDDGWYVVDMGSTNGTYVAGSRITGERRLEGSPDLRFGGMKMRFVTMEVPLPAEPEGKGTRAIASIDRPRRPVAPVPAAAPDTTRAPAAREGVPAIVWLLLLVIAAIAAFVFSQGRA